MIRRSQPPKAEAKASKRIDPAALSRPKGAHVVRKAACTTILICTFFAAVLALISTTAKNVLARPAELKLILAEMLTKNTTVQKATGGAGGSAHTFTYLSPTYEEMLADFTAAEMKWKTGKELPSTAQGIAERYGIRKTVLPRGRNRCNPNATTTIGWIPCSDCNSYRNESGRISRYIFQTWKTSEVTPSLCDVASTWSIVNPEYDYFLFDNDAADAIIEMEFGTRIYDAYKCLAVGAAMADFWRLCVVYLYGGVYADIDTTFKNGQDSKQAFRHWGFGNRSEITKRACQEIGWLPNGCALQSIFMYEPFHPVIRGAIIRSLDKMYQRKAHSAYDIAFWSYHLSWVTSDYNNSYFPNDSIFWSTFDVHHSASRKEMKSANNYWLDQMGRENQFVPECLAAAPKNLPEMVIPEACVKSSLQLKLGKKNSEALSLQACCEYCSTYSCAEFVLVQFLTQEILQMEKLAEQQALSQPFGVDDSMNSTNNDLNLTLDEDEADTEAVDDSITEHPAEKEEELQQIENTQASEMFIEEAEQNKRLAIPGSPDKAGELRGEKRIAKAPDPDPPNASRDHK